MTALTSLVMGISIPKVSANLFTAFVVLIPSAISFMPLVISVTVFPLPISCPTKRLRERLPVHVETCDLSETASNQRCNRVCPVSEPGRHTCSDGHHVFYRAADFRSHNVVVCVDTQVFKAQL